jgi:hypothetical protein
MLLYRSHPLCGTSMQTKDCQGNVEYAHNCMPDVAQQLFDMFLFGWTWCSIASLVGQFGGGWYLVKT